MRQVKLLLSRVNGSFSPIRANISFEGHARGADRAFGRHRVGRGDAQRRPGLRGAGRKPRFHGGGAASTGGYNKRTGTESLRNRENSRKPACEDLGRGPRYQRRAWLSSDARPSKNCRDARRSDCVRRYELFLRATAIEEPVIAH